MTKVFVATASAPAGPQASVTPNQFYSPPSLEAMAIHREVSIPDPVENPQIRTRSYQLTGGSSFDVDLQILDSISKRPLRAVNVESGLKRGYTDRLGRLVMHLPRGRNKIIISGSGYVEKGDFTPEAVTFDPIHLSVDLDSDEIFTVFSSGEILPGEFKTLDNPGHHAVGNPGNFESFLRENWLALSLVGAAGLGMYYLGKSRTSA